MSLDYTELLQLFKIFAVSLVLGGFIGLERERKAMRPLGIRSFAFISGIGTLAAYVAETTEMLWVLPAAFLVIGTLIVIGHIGYLDQGRRGLTTELAAVMTFGIGILVQTGPLELAVALGVTTAALLHFKPQLHALADHAGGKHMYAMLQFAMVAFIVLPVLPNEPYGPFNVVNPRNIWLMVVLVSGINLAGYVAYKLIGPQSGGAVAGLLGGMISSTATTFSFARRARSASSFNYVAALAIILATAVTVPRMAIEISIVNQQFLRYAWPALLIVFGASLVPFAYLWFSGRGREDAEMPDVQNPVQLGAALIFGAIYGIVTLAMAAGEYYYGEAGTYLVSVISGLTNVDAITLSSARLAGRRDIPMALAQDVVVIAYLSNLLMKAVLAAIVGNRRLGKIVIASFGLTFVVGLAVIVFM
jgi:uncharacterized membrane protein (DUF4010 family)